MTIMAAVRTFVLKPRKKAFGKQTIDGIVAGFEERQEYCPGLESVIFFPLFETYLPKTLRNADKFRELYGDKLEVKYAYPGSPMADKHGGEQFYLATEKGGIPFVDACNIPLFRTKTELKNFLEFHGIPVTNPCFLA